MTDNQDLIKALRDVPDFPKPGIIFKDITPLLGDSKLFKRVIDSLAKECAGKGITKVVGIEARGFIFGAALAYAMGIGFVPCRKKGKLPYKTISASFDLEYGSAVIEMHNDALTSADKVVIVDDLLATGGTSNAAIDLVRKLGAEVALCAFVCELGFLKGGQKLKAPYKSLLPL